MQPYIVSTEDSIIKAKDDVSAAYRAFAGECSMEGHGHPYPENRDNWGTLYTNALQLKKQTDRLVDALAKEFK